MSCDIVGRRATTWLVATIISGHASTIIVPVANRFSLLQRGLPTTVGILELGGLVLTCFALPCDLASMQVAQPSLNVTICVAVIELLCSHHRTKKAQHNSSELIHSC